MKKLILSLVLATITLPAMALTADQQAKLQNAFGLLQAQGIDPTVMINDVADAGLNLSYDWGNNVQDNTNWQYKLVTSLESSDSDKGDFVVHRGSEAQTVLSYINSSTDSTKTYTHYSSLAHGYGTQFTLDLAQDDYKYYWVADEFVVNGTSYDSDSSASVIGSAVESAYDANFDRLDNYVQLSDSILGSVGGDLSGSIQEEAEDLKYIIQFIAYQVAAVDILKNTKDVCVNDQGASVGGAYACKMLASAVIDINTELQEVKKLEYYTVYDSGAYNGTYSYYGNWSGANWYKKDGSGSLYTAYSMENNRYLNSVVFHDSTEKYKNTLDNILLHVENITDFTVDGAELTFADINWDEI